jgi:hypothetical protein
MRSVLVVVAEEFSEQRPQVLLIQHNDVVQTFSPECPNDTFRNRVRMGRMNGCGDGIDTDPSGSLAEVAPLHHVSIPQQIERGHRKQVGRPQVMRMVGQERPPGLARRALRSSPAVAPDRAIADHDAQLEQFASDALGAPQPVLARHGGDQFLDFGTEMRTSASRAGLPTPE